MIQLQGSPATPVNSHSSSVSDQSAPRLLSEEFDSGAARAYDSSEKDLGNVTELAHSTHVIARGFGLARFRWNCY
jgi:hypothetical protein